MYSIVCGQSAHIVETWIAPIKSSGFVSSTLLRYSASSAAFFAAASGAVLRKRLAELDQRHLRLELRVVLRDALLERVGNRRRALGRVGIVCRRRCWNNSCTASRNRDRGPRPGTPLFAIASSVSMIEPCACTRLNSASRSPSDACCASSRALSASRNSCAFCCCDAMDREVDQRVVLDALRRRLHRHAAHVHAILAHDHSHLRTGADQSRDTAAPPAGPCKSSGCASR